MGMMDRMHVGSFIAGKEVKGLGRETLSVHSPFNGEVIGHVDLALDEDIDFALENAYQTFNDTMKKMPAYRRSEILGKTAELLKDASDEFVHILALEAGKPVRDARNEVERAVQVLRFAAEEAKGINGEVIPMDGAIGGENRLGLVKFYPLGVVVAITPFNFPLNLALHKIAPAVAAGNTVVLKPAEKTPLSSIKLAYLFKKAGLPDGVLNVIMGKGSQIGAKLVSDHRVSKVTFTGSLSVGMKINQLASFKKVTLELGSNAANIVFADADMDLAVAKLIKGAFSYAGQACIAAQRIYVEREKFQYFTEQFVKQASQLTLGNPLDESTDIGPLINEKEAIRVEQWVNEAVKQGAKIEIGGKREGTLYYPTVLTQVESSMKVVCQEIFAPVVSVIPFDQELEVIEMANDSRYGLQAGVFTSDINRALRLAEQLEMGGVWINEVSTYRQDNYPYGGVKFSGIGKEGVPYAIRDMLEMKFIGINMGS